MNLLTAKSSPWALAILTDLIELREFLACTYRPLLYTDFEIVKPKKGHDICT